MTQRPEVQVPVADRPRFSCSPVLCKHNLQTLPYFGDEALVELLDRIPRSHLRIWTSKDGGNRSSEYTYVDTTGIRGTDILSCVARGEFWVNIQRVDKLNDVFATIASQLYDSLQRQCPHFRVTYVHSYLLLSSPKMYFNLHVDSYENMFWCIRGGKRFIVHPPTDRKLLTQDLLEDICAGAIEDFLPSQEGDASLRREYDIVPGDMLSWPQHSPHGFVNNAQVNLGLGTFHGTQASMTRIRNYQASRYFRERWPMLRGEVRHGALATSLRRGIYLGIKKLKPPQAPRRLQF